MITGTNLLKKGRFQTKSSRSDAIPLIHSLGVYYKIYLKFGLCCVKMKKKWDFWLDHFIFWNLENFIVKNHTRNTNPRFHCFHSRIHVSLMFVHVTYPVSSCMALNESRFLSFLLDVFKHYLVVDSLKPSLVPESPDVINFFL